MSLLTTEQRIIFDETIRLRHVDALNDGEEGLTVTHGHKGKLLPGNRVRKVRAKHTSLGRNARPRRRTRGDPRPNTHPAHPRDDETSRRRDARRRLRVIDETRPLSSGASLSTSRPSSSRPSLTRLTRLVAPSLSRRARIASRRTSWTPRTPSTSSTPAIPTTTARRSPIN